MNRNDILRRAFDFRRAWSAEQGHDASSFGSCDSLILSMLLDLDRPAALVVPDGELREALAQTLATLGRAEPLSLLDVTDQEAPLQLLSFNQIGRSELEDVLYLVHDLPRSLPLSLGSRLVDRRLILFSFLSPATWSSRLALLTSSNNEADASGMIERLSGILHLNELDPLSLYDELQALRGTILTSEEGIEDPIKRCRELERRLRGLEVSGLIRHQTLLADADRRRKPLP